MNIINFYTEIYGKLYSKNSYVDIIFKPLRFITRKLGNYHINKVNSFKLNNQFKPIDDLIVSLTSYPKRIENLWKVIYSIKNQTIQPKKILLYLAESQFPQKILPESLTSLIDDQFKIIFIKEDLKSHKKFFYVFRDYPDFNIITVDDDIIYHPRIIENLISTHNNFPQSIIANCTRKISYKQNNLLPYKNWGINKQPLNDQNLIQIGMGGVLYPKGILPELVLDKNLFLQLCPRGDDIWLNTMARINNIKIIQSCMILNFLEISQNTDTLSQINVTEGWNDKQIENINKFFTQHYNTKIY